MDNLTSVATQSAKESSVSVHDNETEFLVGLEQLGQGFGVKLVVTKVKGRVDRLERLEVYVDLSLLSLRGQDFATVNNKAIGRDLAVQLETLLSGGDGG